MNSFSVKKFTAAIFVPAMVLWGCTSSNKNISYDSSYNSNPGLDHPDYNYLYYWAANPLKKNLSDSTPAPYKNFVKDSTVDVFFIHPTTYTNDTAVNKFSLTDLAEKRYWNANINDAALNAYTDYSTILKQASAFNRYRVFAPRYRQAHLASFYIADSLAKEFFDTAYSDIKNAFTYYLSHYNEGRPFIIASHSQGTVHAGRLMKEMIENTELAKRMVAAYVIGMAVPVDYFSKCLPCSTAAQTGCFVGWRTFKKGYEPEAVTRETFRSFVVNPLTWTMDSLPAKRSLNKGAVLFRFNKPLTHAVSAEIHDNILWSSKPHFFGSLFFTKKNYHIGDINLFWKNIRDNLDERVESFRTKERL